MSSAREPAGWHRLRAQEHDDAWALVERHLSFRPSVDPAKWPSFDEPSGSVTFDISAMVGPTVDDDVTAALRAGLVAVTDDGSHALALDWQHGGYRIVPREMSDAPDQWRIPALPDGDYFLFVAPRPQLRVVGASVGTNRVRLRQPPRRDAALPRLAPLADSQSAKRRSVVLQRNR